MRYQDLRAWQLGIDLSEQIYYVTRSFPKEELFGLTSQMRRSARSVYANIAEGFGRKSVGEFIRFLLISNGSLFELESDLELTRRIKLVPESRFLKLQSSIQETSRVLDALMKGAKSRRRA